MIKRSKRYKALQNKATATQTHNLAEAVALVKESKSKFDETVELHLRLSINT